MRLGHRRSMTRLRRSASSSRLIALRTPTACNVRIDSVVRRGAPWEKLANVATEIGADIIVGADGQRGAARQGLLGTVASRLVTTSPRSVVVGRETDLDALHAALLSAKDHSRTTVFVTGEAGAGKTPPVDFFLEQANARGPLLAGRGACVEQYGSGQAYLPVLDAIGTLCRGRRGDRVVEIMAKHAPTWLVQMPIL